MKPGSVIVDVAVDQGGCVETCHATTHSDPIFLVDGVIHYCVANMPGAVPRTSTYALSNATLPYAEKLARFGVVEAVKRDAALARGVNTYDGKLTYKAVADAFWLCAVSRRWMIRCVEVEARSVRQGRARCRGPASGATAHGARRSTQLPHRDHPCWIGGPPALKTAYASEFTRCRRPASRSSWISSTACPTCCPWAWASRTS